MFHDPLVRLQKKLNSSEGILISNYHNILYLTGFKTSDQHEHEAHLLITKNSVVIFTDRRYSPEFEHVIFYSSQKPFSHYLCQELKKENVTHLAIEAHILTLLEYQAIIEKNPHVTISASTYITERFRLRKTHEEIKKIKKACEITDQCLSEIAKTIHIGQTEKEIAFRIEFWIKSKGHNISFYPIVAVDKNSAIPHYNAQQGGGIVKKNSLILIDLGVRYENYCSDMTRMLVKGAASNIQLKIYKHLLDIQEKTIRSIKKNQVASEVDTYCRTLVNKYKLPIFAHSTGHGVGLEIHESPALRANSLEKLCEGSVFTVEPGVYYKNRFGMRIEDTVAIHKNNVEVLTRFPKALTQI